MGIDGGCRSRRYACDTRISGWWSGVTVALSALAQQEGEKRLRPIGARDDRTEKEKTAQREKTEREPLSLAPRPRQRGRPARQESAHGFNPKRRRACLCGGDPEEEGTSMAIAGRGGNDEEAKQDAL